MLHESAPIRKRPSRAERLIPMRKDPAESTGRLILSDVTRGRNMGRGRAGEIKRLLVLEQTPQSVPRQSPVSTASACGGSFSIQRILGTVPVEPDGSAYFEVPAMRSLLFVALDENDLAVKKMQSFVTVQPGETTGCVGCHEAPNGTAARIRPHPTVARPSQRHPSRITPDSRASRKSSTSAATSSRSWTNTASSATNSERRDGDISLTASHTVPLARPRPRPRLLRRAGASSGRSCRRTQTPHGNRAAADDRQFRQPLHEADRRQPL